MAACPGSLIRASVYFSSPCNFKLVCVIWKICPLFFSQWWIKARKHLCVAVGKKLSEWLWGFTIMVQAGFPITKKKRKCETARCTCTSNAAAGRRCASDYVSSSSSLSLLSPVGDLWNYILRRKHQCYYAALPGGATLLKFAYKIGEK